MLGSNVAENMSGRLCLSRSIIPLAMNAVAGILTFLVMDPLIGSELLEWGWHHSEDINPDWFPMMTQSSKVDSRLSGEHGIFYTMKCFVISIVIGS